MSTRHSISVPRTARSLRCSLKVGSRAAIAALFLAGAASAAAAESVVQLPVDSLLDGRPVSTFTAGSVVRWTAGVDQHDGFATNAAIAALKQSGPGLPDDATFPANADHPEMVLHFSNAAAATSQQAHLLASAGSFELELAQAHYSKLYLALTSSSGDAALSVTLDYATGDPTHFDFTLPDWGTGKPLPTEPPIFFALISGLHKWDESDSSVDTPSHALTGVAIAADDTRVLTKLELSKPGADQDLVFWGATGVTESAGAGTGGASASGSGGAGGGETAGNGGSITTGGGGVGGMIVTTSSAGAVGVAGASNTAGAASTAGSSNIAGGSSMAGAFSGEPRSTSSGCGVASRGAPAAGMSGLCAMLALGLLTGRARRTRYLRHARAISPCKYRQCEFTRTRSKTGASRNPLLQNC